MGWPGTVGSYSFLSSFLSSLPARERGKDSTKTTPPASRL